MHRRTRLWLIAAAVVLVAVASVAAVRTLAAPAHRSGASAADGGSARLGAGPSGKPSAPASGPGSAGPRPGGFVHPGVVVGAAQLDFVRGRVQAGAQPWAGAYADLRASPYASLSRTAKPRADVECGSSSNPDNGCTDERTDALAAYADALVWYLSRDARYATKAIELLDAWSATLKTHTNSNAPLQTGWAGAGWARAGRGRPS